MQKLSLDSSHCTQGHRNNLFIRVAITATFLLICSSCIDPYPTPGIEHSNRKLVVYGYINAGDSSAYAKLSWSQALASSDKPVPENGAQVRIEDASGNVAAFLNNTGDGVYRSGDIYFAPSTTYRLRINIQDGREYASKYISLKKTPPIDSISYQVDKTDHLSIQVNTHDDSGECRHFRWRYIETFEYVARYTSGYTMRDGAIVLRPFTESIRTCWRSDTMHQIILKSTKTFSRNHVRGEELISIPRASWKLNRKYSVLVEQQCLSQEAFDYWTTMRSSTEALGSLYDPAPSQPVGNVTCITSPMEEVVGLFETRETRRHRIFIIPSDLPEGFTLLPAETCTIDTVSFHFVSGLNPDRIIELLASPTPFGPGAYTTSASDCVDCRVKGGVTSKPDFWE